jgi:hypothetical protein
MLGVQSKPKTKHDNVSSIRPAKSPPAGRDRLKHFDEQISLAKTAIVEIESKIECLQEIVSGADVHHKALQACIEADNGRSLSDYSAGKVAADSSIARLVLLADNSKRAATAAQSALPSAIAQLEDANRQLLDLGEQRAQELNRVLTTLGDLEADEYRKTFEKLGRLHDQLVGFANVAQSSLGDIQLILDPLRAPRFQFPSMRGHIDSDPFLRHQPSSLTVSESSRKWSEIRERLSADANADVNDLLIG